MLLAGMLVAWRVLSGVSGTSDAKQPPVETSEFAQNVIFRNKPVLVSFEAEWSGACRKVAPVVQRVADSVDGKATVFVVDIDKCPEVAQKYGIRNVPSLMIFKDGEVVETVNSADENTLRSRLLAHAG